jgi:hypothetical protein
MSKLKIALIASGLVVALAAVAQAAEVRLGNGSTWVTINPSNGNAGDARGAISRSQELPITRGSNGHI